MCNWHVSDPCIHVSENWVFERFTSGMWVPDRCVSCIWVGQRVVIHRWVSVTCFWVWDRCVNSMKVCGWYSLIKTTKYLQRLQNSIYNMRRIVNNYYGVIWVSANPFLKRNEWFMWDYRSIVNPDQRGQPCTQQQILRHPQVQFSIKLHQSQAFGLLCQPIKSQTLNHYIGGVS